MNRIYIDFTNGSLGNEKVKYHGGGDFSRFILFNMMNYAKNQNSEFELVVLWPIYAKVVTEEEIKIINTCNVKKVNSLFDVNYENNAVLFMPLIDSFKLSIVGKIKEKNKNLKIYIVLHGVRILDVCKYDKYDKYFYTGIKKITFYLWGRRFLAGYIAKKNLKKYIPMVDRVYTVSNNSMQKINSCSRPKYIKYFTRNIMSYDMKSRTYEKVDFERYILFVNANRYEKNFIRTLIAFCKYKEKSQSDIRLFVIGMSEELERNMHRIKEIDWKIVNSDVKFMGYIASEQLKILYKNCEFLLYTSKSEGFGLPPLEAMLAGRPTVASATTSVPEVLGMLAYYINPYDIASIEKGISYMDKKQHQLFYIKLLNEYKRICIEKGKNDIEVLIRELYEKY